MQYAELYTKINQGPKFLCDCVNMLWLAVTDAQNWCKLLLLERLFIEFLEIFEVSHVQNIRGFYPTLSFIEEICVMKWWNIKSNPNAVCFRL